MKGSDEMKWEVNGEWVSLSEWKERGVGCSYFLLCENIRLFFGSKRLWSGVYFSGAATNKIYRLGHTVMSQILP